MLREEETFTLEHIKQQIHDIRSRPQSTDTRPSSCPDPWSSPSSSEIGEMQSKQNVQMPTKHSNRMENINRVANGDNDSPDDQPRRARRNDTSTPSASSALSVGTSADSIKAPKRRTKLKTKTNLCAEERARNLERAVAALEKQARDADKIRGEHLHRRVDSIERHFCQTGGRSTKDQVESTDNTLFPKNERFREKQARDTGKISTEKNGGRFGPLQESNFTPRSSEDSAIRILEDRLDFLSKLILRGPSFFGESGPSEEGNMITRNTLQPQEYTREYSNKRPSEHSAVRNLEDRLDFLKRFILGGLPLFGQQSHNADHSSLNTFDGRACGSSLRNRLGSQTYGSPLIISLARTAKNDKTGRPFGGNSADRLEERIDNLQTLITGTEQPDGASPESEHTKNLEERIRFLENCLIEDGRDLPRETEGGDLDNALKDRLDSVERKLRGTHSDMLSETSQQSPVRPVKDKVVSLENLLRASGKKIKGGPSEGYPSRNLADRVDSLERFADDMQTDEATSKDLDPDPEENLVKEMKKDIDNERKEDLENERKEALENTLKPKIDVLDYQIRGAHCGSSTSLDWQQRSRPAAERIRSLENLMGVPGKELAQEPSGTSPERNIQDEVQSLENLKGLTECVKDRLNALEANLHGTAKILQGGTYHPIPDRPLTDRIASLETLLRDDDGQNEHNLNRSIPSRVDSLERMAGENGPMNNRVNRLENLLGGQQSGWSSDDTNAVKQPTPLTDRITSLEHAARSLGHAVKGGPSDGYPERTPAHRVKSLERIAEQLPLAASSPTNKPKASAWPKFLFWSKPS